ncbi:MAG TPA: bifunctional phosphopantothenoylcysteine decarboxylase/phosphopantothenate--cysteine ligase CoaBC [Chloroflexota bacterium]|nr:bifunctional phosphopantothenoylcysteine decarboxylase/phosphopantothenate--cysteine ligase CoaBC [Chloroflexota bacterium]
MSSNDHSQVYAVEPRPDSSTVVLGVCGGIAAYKALEVTSTLVQREWAVRVVMTAAATRFVTPLSFESISNQPVLHDLWAEQPDMNIAHIRLAHRASVLAIVPATADVLARLAHGLADDALTATALASSAPLVIAPAMNTGMWNHPATQANVATLLARGARIIGPDSGRLAEGTSGIGRLAPVADIVEAIVDAARPRRDLAGRHIVVTAGPTQEALDPVRYISNHSSGKMGYALAEGARDRGAQVTLVSGPVALPAPDGVIMHRITTAAEMLAAVQDALTPGCTLIMAAAVADYAPAERLNSKRKRGGEPLTLTLVPTPDILASLRRPEGMRLIAFAAETDQLLEHATEKLRRKGADMLVANDVSEPDAGFNVDTNHVWLLRGDQPPEELPLATKQEIAGRILDAFFSNLK